MLRTLLAKFWKSENGATSIEYAVLAVVIALGIIASVKIVSTNLQSNLNSVATGFAG